MNIRRARAFLVRPGFTTEQRHVLSRGLDILRTRLSNARKVNANSQTRPRLDDLAKLRKALVTILGIASETRSDLEEASLDLEMISDLEIDNAIFVGRWIDFAEQIDKIAKGPKTV